jgi:hypothetical protein
MTTACDTNTRTETERLFADLDKPSLHALSYALRHPDTWPEGFVWNYGNCANCAMGLAHALWNGIPVVGPKDGPSVMAHKFAMPWGEAKRIFLGGFDWTPTRTFTKGFLWWSERYLKFDLKRVTPEMVADQIDAYLARAE